MKIVVLDGYTENPGDISWGPIEARERIMQTTADNIRAFLDGAPVNVVNK